MLDINRVIVAVFVVAPATVMMAAVPTYIGTLNQVPDWQQPGDAVNNVAGYPNWCSPTAVANAFGWWEDAKGCAGLTDGLLYPMTTQIPAGNPPAGQWNEKLWQDGTIELGWYMNTGGWQTNNPQLPGAGGTLNNRIGPGGVAYAQAGWVDGVVTKTAYANASVRTYGVGAGGLTASTIWNDYKADIDNGLPVVVSWDKWVNPDTGQPWEAGSDIMTYQWNMGGTWGHTTTGVGYIDVTANMGDEWLIVYDNWSTTAKKVAMPLFTAYLNENNFQTMWVQNDHFDIPEPASLLLLSFGLLLRRVKR